MKSPISGIKVLLMGDICTGKTEAIRTLLRCGIQPLCIFTEPSFDVLGPEIADGRIPMVYIPPIKPKMADLKRKSASIGTKTYSALCKEYDPDRAVDSPFDALLSELEDFVDPKTGKHWGCHEDWGTNRALVIDSVTGITKAAWQQQAGIRVALDKPDYGLTQKLVEGLVDQLLLNTRCHVILNSHIDKYIDQVQGGTKITALLPGQALAQTLGINFTDVILAQRAGKSFSWNTIEPGVSLKARNTPFAADIPPSYEPLIAEWKRKGGIIETEVT